MSKYTLRLYIIGDTPVTRRAVDNLKALCKEPEVAAVYDFEVINLIENPTLAEEERILATPVLIKKLPEPMRRIIGDLSDRERILVGLDLYERGEEG
ncbi:MAG: circadian clock protein KaiB [Candidatus Thiodiazotropha taylori]|nr:circadian clock protein KaiB [Candidatus Thiodiazotropha taylori]MCG7923903.1 circadian clock protein KaiB [Candidatus Thiodiazotropha taylori]MCG7972678.1 circadian clock protein KaiB [Candidatus Thiodiazotropha taylori]